MASYTYDKDTVSIKKLMLEIKVAIPSVVVKYITKNQPGKIEIVTESDLSVENVSLLASTVSNHVFSTLRKEQDGRFIVREEENGKLLSIKKYKDRNNNVFSNVVYAEEYNYTLGILDNIKKYHYFEDNTPVLISTVLKDTIVVDGKTLIIDELI